jgi:dTDP-4-amino-4,6-dideoxygalactose transaminase
MSVLPVMRPKLPRLDRLVPYLSAIDEARTYSNFGPLVRSFEERLAGRNGLPAGTVASVANATIGITLALAVQGARPGTLCVIPAWTFVASAHAATMAGLIPYFIDVEKDSWALDPAATAEAIARAPAAVGAVMPVVPFGRPIDIAAWEDFQVRSGIPVVIDAAAGFDTVTPSTVPTVVSLHATKVIGIGEGGFVMSTDQALIRDVRARSNFGFVRSRDAWSPAVNAKLSEYHAAVGLAALDEWAEVRDEWMAVAAGYRAALGQSNTLTFQDGFGETWITSTCVVSLTEPTAAQLENNLARAGIDSRRWWGAGAHAHRATAGLPRALLPETKLLSESTLGLPFFRDLRQQGLDRVVECVVAPTGSAAAG